MGTKRARRRLWLSHHGTPSTTQERAVKASAGPCLPLASGVPSSKPGAHGPLRGLVQPFSILCVFLLIILPRVGLGLSVPSDRSWSPTQPNPELTTCPRRGPCQDDRPQEHSPETRAEQALMGLWSGQM